MREMMSEIWSLSLVESVNAKSFMNRPLLNASQFTNIASIHVDVGTNLRLYCFCFKRVCPPEAGKDRK